MSESSELISAIIPCFNQARFLAEAIESVRTQTYRRHEIIVVDDGSKDATAEVASRFPGVRLISQRNQGPAAARNAGVRASNGGYLVFLDADDRLLPNALEIGMRHLASQPEAAFVSGHCRHIAGDGSLISIPKQPLVQHDHYLALLFRNYVWACSTVLFRRNYLEEVGGFNTSLRVKGAEDYELYLRIARKFPVFCHGEVVADYRQYHLDGGNVSGNAGGMLRATLTALRGQWPYVKRNPDYVKQYRRGIQHKKMMWGNLVIRDFTGPRQRPVSGLLQLLRYDPVTLLKFLSRRVSRSVFHGSVFR